VSTGSCITTIYHTETFNRNIDHHISYATAMAGINLQWMCVVVGGNNPEFGVCKCVCVCVCALLQCVFGEVGVGVGRHQLSYIQGERLGGRCPAVALAGRGTGGSGPGAHREVRVGQSGSR